MEQVLHGVVLYLDIYFLRVMVFISAEKPNLEYSAWVYIPDWHLGKP